MEHTEFEKGQVLSLVDAVEYIPGSIVTKSILRKDTGYITISSFDTGETWQTKSSPFDNLIQIIDGRAEVFIDEKSNQLEAGQAIIIPAHAANSLMANTRFKMLSTLIKSGYEDIHL
ncbi:cupin domain-containing protein [Algoriphagus aestuariicola]|jgi:quercetin dioxygenase-like cupin family protein|uniref:Cupin domain-containing protein n=1 Tax=Algoriphagus aestuariicola TaxID=1852016 RepID=A0ABS3BQA0_9BACT|nr:cupin domain-containing protein [Algoriphagus aestuariicola]MBN7801245.1 cupin domain-containing protein [Algoriphagus aestuariicola]